MLEIATWNVNSIRAREERLLAWLRRTGPDVVALQETKVLDDDFPYTPLRLLGYEAVHFGQRAYNGVAILAKSHLLERSRLPVLPDVAESRILAAQVAGLIVVSMYVPNGSEVGSPKWQHKLRWLDALPAWLAAHLPPGVPTVLLGDFNIAPRDADVAKPDAWRDSVLTHPEARQRFERIVAMGYVDAIAQCHPEGGVYSWWDYRRLGFAKNNGLRIDHALVSRGAAAAITRGRVERDERKGQKPSDHAPVVVTLDTRKLGG